MDKILYYLGKCDLFGIEINQHPSRSGYDVRSLTYCELQCLDLTSLVLIFDQYPNFKKSFTDALSDELSFNITDVSESNVSVSITVFPKVLCRLVYFNDILLWVINTKTVNKCMICISSSKLTLYSLSFFDNVNINFFSGMNFAATCCKPYASLKIVFGNLQICQ